MAKSWSRRSVCVGLAGAFTGVHFSAAMAQSSEDSDPFFLVKQHMRIDYELTYRIPGGDPFADRSFTTYHCGFLDSFAEIVSTISTDGTGITFNLTAQLRERVQEVDITAIDSVSLLLSDGNRHVDFRKARDHIHAETEDLARRMHEFVGTNNIDLQPLPSDMAAPYKCNYF